MKDTISLGNVCLKHKSAGKTDEEIVSFLRTEGCSKIESIAILRQALNIELKDAKSIVHQSGAWAHKREDHNRFHETLESELREIEEGKGRGA